MGIQAEREQRDWTIVVVSDLRPAGDGKHCFYCGAPLWSLHKEGCVIRKGAGWYHVAIRNNTTGEERLYRHDMAWDDDGSSMYQWTDGNYGCDCNRELFWHRAVGDEAEEFACGTEVFSALYAELPDGTRIEIDGPAQRTGAEP